ncbi:phosphatase PAP2 family protein [Kitasatospora sp. NPDC127111]|uniref:phosphatase PAP2 family protein n=1 Tax=Kitasatospora sp. NPDC127111 TaxID=3345363 RepID=UPI00362F80BF
MHLTNSTARITPRNRHLLRHSALAIVCAALFAVLAALVQTGWHPLHRLDHAWTDGMHRYARDHTAWTAAMQTLSDIGGTITMRTLLGIAAVWLWLIGARILAGWVVAQALVGWGAQWAFKLAFDRERPSFPDPVSHAGGPAFPSGHAMASAITCAVLVGLFWSQTRRGGRIAACSVAALAALAVGWTRIALGVHWPSDVLGGWLAAGIVLGTVTVAVELWRPGALARDVRRVNWRTRPRVQRVLVSPTGVTPSGVTSTGVTPTGTDRRNPDPAFEDATDRPDGMVR